MATQSMKRIHAVSIKREQDDSPDTSWLGEYSGTASSEYSIDRAHSLECPINTGAREYVALAIKDNQEQGGAVFPTFALAEKYTQENGAIGEAWEIEERDAECDCGEHGDMGRNEYRYFNPSFNYVDAKGAALPENTPEEVREYVRQDYERMERIQRGDICFYVIGAEAVYSTEANRNLLQKVTSGWVGGIESDADESDFKEMEEEQLSELRDQLHALGFSKRAVAAAFREVEHAS